MSVPTRLAPALLLSLAVLAESAAAQAPRVSPYAYGGIGVGRFVFLCSGCGPEQTALIPSASVGLSFNRVGLDLGLAALGWTHISDRYTVLTVGTTWRPRSVPLFVGGGVGLAIRQYPDVCSSCSGTPGIPVRIRGSSTDPAMMLQLGGRIPVAYRVTIEPFAQYSRFTRSEFAVGHADHLAVGLRVDGR
jgi:hypothetical protein